MRDKLALPKRDKPGYNYSTQQKNVAYSVPFRAVWAGDDRLRTETETESLIPRAGNRTELPFAERVNGTWPAG